MLNTEKEARAIEPYEMAGPAGIEPTTTGFLPVG